MKTEHSDIDYLNAFEERIQQNLLHQLYERGVLGKQLLGSDDLDDKFDYFLQDYIKDALLQIVEYPLISFAWATYIGIGLAYLWDADFEKFSNLEYEMLYGSQGFDNMDDHILYDIMGKKTEEVKDLVKLIQSISQYCLSALKAEKFEEQSTMSFHVYVRIVIVAFRIGAAMQLYSMGYKYEKVEA